MDRTWIEGKGIYILEDINDAIGLQLIACRCHNSYRYSMFADGRIRAILATYVDSHSELRINKNPIISPFDALCLGMVDRQEFKVLVRQAILE